MPKKSHPDPEHGPLAPLQGGHVHEEQDIGVQDQGIADQGRGPDRKPAAQGDDQEKGGKDRDRAARAWVDTRPAKNVSATLNMV